MTTEWLEAFQVADVGPGTADYFLPKVGWLFMIDVGDAIVDVHLRVDSQWEHVSRQRTGQIVVSPPLNLQRYEMDSRIRCYGRTVGRIEISRDYDPHEQRD